MKDLAFVFKALGDSTRVEIVKMLLGKELCVCDILETFKISQPAISHHLKTLKQANVIIDRKEGKWVFYKLNLETIRETRIFIEYLEAGSQQIKYSKPSSPQQLTQVEDNKN